MIKLSKPSPRLYSSLLLAFERWMLVVGKPRGPTKKKKPPVVGRKKN